MSSKVCMNSQSAFVFLKTKLLIGSVFYANILYKPIDFFGFQFQVKFYELKIKKAIPDQFQTGIPITVRHL